MLFLLLVLCGLLPLEARGQGGEAKLGDAAQIRRVRERSNAAIAAHDTAGIAATLAPHLIEVISTSAQVIGRQAMVESLGQQFVARPDVVYRRTPKTVRVFAPWRMASEHGTWRGSWTSADGVVRVGGSYFAKWRKIEGQWLIESETFVPEYCRGGKYCETVP